MIPLNPPRDFGKKWPFAPALGLNIEVSAMLQPHYHLEVLQQEL